MTTRKTHDADLCERIRALEERVKELEARPTGWYGGWWQPHYCYTGCPIHTPTYYPTWTSPNTTITYGSGTQTAPDGTQFTYTSENVS
jgi:hypothetical protein